MVTDIAFSIYPVTDMKKSRAFYEGVLGLKLNPEYDGSKNENWVEYLVGSGCLALGCWSEWKTSEEGACVALEVDNFEELTADLKKRGILFRIEPSHYPTCSMAVINDPDKNKVLIHQKKK